MSMVVLKLFVGQCTDKAATIMLPPLVSIKIEIFKSAIKSGPMVGVYLQLVDCITDEGSVCTNVGH